MHTVRFKAMASRCEICVDGVDADRAQTWSAAAIAEVARIEAKYSRYRADSVVSAINAGAGSDEPVAVDAETEALLVFGDQLHARSGGRFDLSSGVLRRAWDFKSARLPEPAVLQAALARVGWSRVRLAPGSVQLEQAGMELDFGGIGKEYAADRAATVLLNAGAAHGYVNLGGDIRVLGPQADGQAWRFGIQHPREFKRMVATVALAHGALATSGDYERYFEWEGRRYCHVLDARTGWPVSTWQSVSVVAPVCVAAGALATVSMLAGSEAPDLLAQEGLAYLLVDAEGAVQASGAPDGFQTAPIKVDGVMEQE